MMYIGNYDASRDSWADQDWIIRVAFDAGSTILPRIDDLQANSLEIGHIAGSE